MNEGAGAERTIVFGYEDDSLAVAGLTLRFSKPVRQIKSEFPEEFVSFEVNVTLGDPFTSGQASWWGYKCLGWDFEQFAFRLREFHQTLEGEVHFGSSNGFFLMHMRVTNKVRGQLGVWIEMGDLSPLWHPRCHLEVLDLALDQSYLPGIIHDISGFLHDNEISTKPLF